MATERVRAVLSLVMGIAACGAPAPSSTASSGGLAPRAPTSAAPEPTPPPSVVACCCAGRIAGTAEVAPGREEHCRCGVAPFPASPGWTTLLEHAGCGSCEPALTHAMNWETTEGPVSVEPEETVLANPPEWSHEWSTRIELEATGADGLVRTLHAWVDGTQPDVCWPWPRILEARTRGDDLLLRYRGTFHAIDEEERVLVGRSGAVERWIGRASEVPPHLRADGE